MRYLTTTLILIALCIALLATQTGCLLLAAGAGAGAGVAYVRGDTETVLTGTPKQVTAAGEAAAKEMALALISSDVTGLDGKVVARTAGDTPVVVTVRAQGPESSRVSIRVGRFGDEAMQNSVLDKIRRNLETTATASVAE